MDLGLAGGEMQVFLEQIAELAKWRPGQVKVVITSRPVTYIESGLQRKAYGACVDVRLEERLVDQDIAKFVAHHIASANISAEDQVRIREAVPGRANGLFLYARLAIDAFTRPGADVTTVLDELPRDLDVLYAGLLKQHARRSDVPEEMQSLILQLVTHATRPLRLLEIANVINITQRDPAERNLKATKHLVRAACGPLLEILPDETVSVVHHSLTEFLTGIVDKNTSGDGGGNHQRDNMRFEPGATHQRLALICLKYLESEIFDQLDATPDGPSKHDTFARYAGKHWFIHARKASLAGFEDQAEMTSVLDRIFHSTERLAAISTMYHGGFPTVTRRSQETPVYVAAILGLHSYLETLLLRNTGKVEVNLATNPEESPLWAASKKGYIEIVESLIKAGANPNEHDTNQSSGLTPLHNAVARNDPQIVKLLLDAGADITLLTRNRDPPVSHHRNKSPLEWACKRGHSTVVQAMLQHITNIQNLGQAVLWIAPTRCVESMSATLAHPLARRLIEETPKCLPEALFIASAHRDAPMVKTLLSAGAEATVQQSRYGDTNEGALSVLHAWAAGDQNVHPMPHVAHDNCLIRGAKKGRDSSPEETAQVFRMLIAAGADVNQVTPSTYSTPLHYARDVVAARLLVDEGGANVRAVNRRGETLLSLTRDLDVINYILKVLKRDGAAVVTQPHSKLRPNGVDPVIKTPSTSEITLAMLARIRPGRYPEGAGIVDQVQVFLDNGADPAAAVNRDGQTALHLLVQIERASDSVNCDGGFCNVAQTTDMRVVLLKRLLQTPGMNVDIRNSQGQTPLHLLSFRFKGQKDDNSDLRGTLLAAGADIMALDDKGRTPLFFQLKSLSISSDNNSIIGFCEDMVRLGSRLDKRDCSGRTLFHVIMARRNSEKLLQWLVDRAGDVGADPLLADHGGNTLFHEAVSAGNRLIVYNGEKMTAFGFFEQLRALGLDPKRPNHAGTTPLHIASTITPGGLEGDNSRFGEAVSTTVFDWFLGVHSDGDVDVVDQHGITPLHSAATFSEYMVRRLLEFGADPLKQTAEGLNGLHLAARARQANILGMMLEKITLTHSAIQSSDSGMEATGTAAHHQRSPLFYAVASGCLESVRLLLELSPSSAVLHQQRTGQYKGSILEVVAEFEEELTNWPKGSGSRSYGRLEEILDLLIAHDLLPSGHMSRAIEEAVAKKAAYTVECLLLVTRQLSLESRVCDNVESVVTLIEARQKARKPFEEAIITKGRLSAEEFDVAMQCRFFDIVARGLSVPASSCQILQGDCLGGNSSATLLHYLAAGGHAALIRKIASSEVISRLEGPEWVFRENQEARLQNCVIEPLLITACRRKVPNMDVVKLLVEHFDVDVNAISSERKSALASFGSNSTGTTALHVLVSGGHWWQTTQALPYLLARGANVNVWAIVAGGIWARGGRQTPLHTALTPLAPNARLWFYRSAVQLLLNHGADVRAANDWGETCLDISLHDAEVFALLLKYVDKPLPVDLIAAIDKKSVVALEALLVAGVDPNGRRTTVPPTETFLTVDSGPIHSQQGEQKFPLHHVLATDFDSLGEKGLEVQTKMVDLLLEHGADPFAKYEETTLLHQVFAQHNAWRAKSCLRRLLGSGVLRDIDPNCADANGTTLFHLSCRYGFKQSDEHSTPAAILLSFSADIHARDHNGLNALHHLVAGGRRSQAEVDFLRTLSFLASGLVNEQTTSASGGKTPLHEAIAKKSWSGTEVIDVLLEAGADPATVDHEGNTLLHTLLKGYFRVFFPIHGVDKIATHDTTTVYPTAIILDKLLALHGVDINATNNLGETPIFAYIHSGLVRPTDHRLRGISKRGSIETIEKQEVAVLEMFDAKGVDWSVRDTSGKTLLHVAVGRQWRRVGEPTSMSRVRYLARVKYLLAKGIDPSLEDQRNQTALDYAAALRANDVLELFRWPAGFGDSDAAEACAK